MTTQRISFQLTRADYLHVTRVHCWRSSVTQRGLLRRLLIAVTAIAAGSLIGWVGSGGTVVSLFTALREAWGAFLLWIVLAFAFLPLLQQAFIPWQVRRFYAQQKTAQLPHDMSWDGDSFILEVGGSRIVIPFANIHYWRESGQAILLYQNDMMPNFVMKRAFVSPDQLADFRARLKANGIPQA